MTAIPTIDHQRAEEPKPARGHTNRNLVFTVAYDGREFVGWQVQPNGPSVQQALADAWFQVTRERLFPTGSGRTDSGVHALGQPVQFRTNSPLPGDVLVKALNVHLPPTIRIGQPREAQPEFDVVRHAIEKTYRYLIWNDARLDPFLVGRVWHVAAKLDLTAIEDGARHFLGRHDFRAFESKWPNRATSVRTITRLRVRHRGALVAVEVSADGFLYNMVRAMVGTLVDVGRGRRPPTDIVELVTPEADRADSGPTAPAAGLYLLGVTYPPAAFLGLESEPRESLFPDWIGNFLETNPDV